MIHIIIMISCIFFDKSRKNEYFCILVDLCGYYELEGLPHHSSDVFFMGNRFPIDLRVFGHSIGRLHDPNVVKADRKLAVIQWKCRENQ